MTMRRATVPERVTLAPWQQVRVRIVVAVLV